MQKTVEEIYQKKTQLEHILLRPDTYVGNIEKTEANLWVLGEDGKKFVQKDITFVPGLYKIFDEILVNAADNYQRDKSMNMLKVVINPEENFISIWNNGKGIPVQIHKEHNIYVPELIFGHLLTGSNYDDNEKKVVGGRNGYGAKLTNIFSKKFSVEVGDKTNQKLFKMTWRNNLSSSTAPDIKPYKSGQDYVCISFEPDLQKFGGMTNLEDDIVALMKKRVFDMAGIFSTNVKVFLNEELIKIKNFSQYVEYYFEDPEQTTIINDKSTDNERWQVSVAFSDGNFRQVSFVNSICTTRGGTHVNYIADQIIKKVIEMVAKKDKKLTVKPHQVKNNLWIFINCLIENPTFDSQTKDTLTLKSGQFGSKCELSEKFLKNILNSGIADLVMDQAKLKEFSKMAKTMGGGKKSRLLGIKKLEDANDAGTRNAETCTLIITEGDSAKALAMAGIEIVGRDKFGVFPLRGKMLNVREASVKSILANEEIQNLMKILGLQMEKTYTDLKSLRYGSLMIMADQDTDGSHIKGLVINFIHHFWPSLFKFNGFLKEFVTPILKSSKGNVVNSFFTIADFKRWAENTSHLDTWKIKYYKGLGTSTNKEAQEYFNDFLNHRIIFKYENEDDSQVVDLLFNKKKADQRKQWLQNYDPEITVNHNIKDLRYKEFFDKELIHFSNSDNMRSIPSICDGLKPGQRKILFACFKRNLKGEIKVAQLAGYVSEHSAYHHGEVSLQTTIIGLAQNFVGSNNINLLLPIGQFGTRAEGGKDHASARYVFTSLSKVTRALFPEPDDHSLKFLEDDGQSVEPEWYIPILPLCLINGAEGIGTGWSTYVPCYNPREIADAIKGRMRGEEFKNLIPWYKGWTGDILEANSGYQVNGEFNLREDNPDCLMVTELPVGKWTKDYKTFLETLAAPEKGEPDLDDIRENHSNNRINFEVYFKEGRLETFQNGDGGLLKKLKLMTTMQITNMVMFDRNRRLKKYKNVADILEEFYHIRLEFYEKRKDYLISRLERDLMILDNRKRFIVAVIEDEIIIKNVKKRVLCDILKSKGFTQLKDIRKIKSTKINSGGEGKKDEAEDEAEQNDPNDNSETADLVKQYNYLLNMNLWSLTYEKVQNLIDDFDRKTIELESIRKADIKLMWEKDLDEFLDVLGDVEEEEERERLNAPKGKGHGKKAGKRKQTKKNEIESKGKEIDSADVKKVKNPTKQKDVKGMKTKKEDEDLSSQEKDKSSAAMKEEPKKIGVLDKYFQKYNVSSTTTQGGATTSTNNDKKPVDKSQLPLKERLEANKENENLIEKGYKKALGEKKKTINISDDEDNDKTLGKRKMKPSEPKRAKKRKVSSDEEEEEDYEELLGFGYKNKPTLASSSQRPSRAAKEKTLENLKKIDREIFETGSKGKSGSEDEYKLEGKSDDDDESYF